MAFWNRNRNRNSRSGSNNNILVNNDIQNNFANQVETLIPAEVRLLSGCHSEQTSADCGNISSTSHLPMSAGKAGGACTSALLDILYRKQQDRYDKTLTFQSLLLDLRSQLAASGFDQIPQLTSSRPMEMQQTTFDLTGSGTGICRALLIGINYVGQGSGELSGCHNDIYNVRDYLINVQGYQDHNILILADDGQHYPPTRRTIIQALRQLVAQSVAGDAVYVHYSGHGGLINSFGYDNLFKQGNKEYDETLYPVDHTVNGQIRDFSLFNHFVRPMPAGVMVTCVFDCCHSGTVLDLPYSYQPTSAGTIRMRENLDSLSNLAFLYILAGGMLPPVGFENVTETIESVTGASLDAFQGAGADDLAFDGVSDYIPTQVPDEENVGRGDYNYGDSDIDNVVNDPGDYEDSAGAVPVYDLTGYDEGDDNDAAGEIDDDAGAALDDDGVTAYDVGGMTRAMGGGVDAGEDGEDEDGGNVDCGCVADVLRNFLEES